MVVIIIVQNNDSKFQQSDLYNQLMNTLHEEMDLIMKIVAEGISLVESEETNSELRGITQIINHLNCQLMQHMSKTIDCYDKMKVAWGDRNGIIK